MLSRQVSGIPKRLDGWRRRSETRMPPPNPQMRSPAPLAGGNGANAKPRLNPPQNNAARSADQRPSAAEISAHLADHLEALVADLLPAARRQGGTFAVGSVAGEPGQSLRIYQRGEKRGRWRDFATGEHGDALDLVAATRFRGDLRAAIRWGREWLGEGADWRANERVAAMRSAAAPAPDPAHNRRLALAILRETISPSGTLTDLHIRGRGIKQALSQQVIRHHRGLPYYDRDGRVIGRWPAMIVRLNDANGEFVGIHRTWLDGSFTPNPVTKASVPDARKTLGPLGVAWFGPRDVETIVVAEGVETALAASELGRHSLSAWGCCREPDGGPHEEHADPPVPYGLTPVACICADGLARFDPPTTVRRMYVAEDDDARRWQSSPNERERGASRSRSSGVAADERHPPRRERLAARR
jgi:hypothetical protein